MLFFGLNSCAKQTYQLANVGTFSNQQIDSILVADKEAFEMIAPYKKELDGEMSKVISYTEIDLHKDGFNSPLANLNCDMILEETNLIYEKSHHQKVDMCLLNHGGIRRTFLKGNLTVKNVYELMPFENMAVVVTLSGKQVAEMIDYLSNTDKGHPISGLKFQAGNLGSLQINGVPFNENRTYTIVTNDYLQKGGDQMNFLSSPVKLENLDVKLRDMMLDYFKKHDSIIVNLEDRILK